MNENKVIYYTKLAAHVMAAGICWLVLVAVLWQVQDLSILVKSVMLIGLLGAMFLNIYNGRENRYYDFTQPTEQLGKLSESAFTYYIERLYRTLGYYTKVPFACQTSELKKTHEIILRKGDVQIVMHCYNQKEISLEAVQQLVGRLTLYPQAQGQILMIGQAEEKVHQLAELNRITIIEEEGLKAYMAKAADILENYLDGALSAFWCHPFKWFRKHFLEAEPRFMNETMWLTWVKLELKNHNYQISDTEAPKEYGVQFVVQKAKESLAIKCIGIDQKVTLTDLNALKASMPFYEVTKAMLITNSHVSYYQRVLARRLEIELLNFNDFMKWLKKQDKEENQNKED